MEDTLKYMRAFAATLMTIGSLLGVANAAVIYSQETLDTSDRGGYTYFGQVLADDFTTVSDSIVDTISWRGSYYGADVIGTESFTIHFHTNNSGLPSNSAFFSEVISANVVDTGVDLQSKNLYEYSADITDVPLFSGNTYWISIYSNDSPSNYAWANSLDGSIDGSIRNSGGAWGDFDGFPRTNHIFSLKNTVPEPSSALLIVLGSLGLLARRKRTF